MNNTILGCKLQEDLFNRVEDILSPGKSLYFIQEYILNFFKDNSLEKIPESIPVSINLNNITYHGIPDNTILQAGDIVTIDICFSYNGTCIDGAVTFKIGEINKEIKDLIDCNKRVLRDLCQIIKPGIKVNSIIRYISDFVALEGYFILPHGMGHGIGKKLHQKPFISLNNFEDFNYLLQEGDTFTIEPILILYDEIIQENNLGEGYVSKNNRSSQFEIMVNIDELGKIQILNGSLIK